MKKKNQVSNVIQLFPVETNQEKYRRMRKEFELKMFLEQSAQYLKGKTLSNS